jgi:RNA polymerase sigma-70 factor (ECF subfamily)
MMSIAIEFARLARFVEPALVDGSPGLVLAAHGRLSRAVRFTIAHGRIVGVDVVVDPERLARLEIAVL